MEIAHYEVAGHSLRGSRRTNQDRIGIVERDRSVLLVVADGLGGHAGGALAAEIAVETVSAAFRRLRRGRLERPGAFLGMTLTEAHHAIRRAGSRQQPAIEPRTTCVACLVQDGYAYWAHVGDSRLYHFRGPTLRVRTQDHTRVEHLREAGVLSTSDVLHHPDKSRLLRCLGTNRAPDISLGPETALARDDLVLLCSDGLWEAVPPTEFPAELKSGEFDGALEQLLVSAVARRPGRGDNVSAVCLRWLATGPLAAPLRPAAPPVVQAPSEPLSSAGLDDEIARLESLLRDRRR